jgi:three-Cys-motif partner protein
MAKNFPGIENLPFDPEDISPREAKLTTLGRLETPQTPVSDRMHDNEFAEETKDKLRIINDYVHSALPVFFNSSQFDSLLIADLFAGPGKDMVGNPGTPVLFLKTLFTYTNLIRQNGKPIRLLLNDKDSKNFSSLQNVKIEWDKAIAKVDIPLTIEIENKDAGVLFPTVIAQMRSQGTASILCLDQYGVSFVTQDRFRTLIGTGRSDVLFFIASSYIKRFADDFAPIFGIPPDEAKSCDVTRVHDVICDTLASMIPDSLETFVAGFSIHKPPNHYGLVFLTHNMLGLDKFTDVCWKADPDGGSSNTGRMNLENLKAGPLFAEDDTRTDKQRRFSEDLKKYVVNASQLTELDIVLFTYKRGMRGKHAKMALKSFESTWKCPMTLSFNCHTVKERHARYLKGGPIGQKQD